MQKYHVFVSTKTTPQNEPVPGSSQVRNSAGGYAWAVDKWKRLERFLILGSEGGTYYVDARTLTRENAAATLECLAEDPARTVEIIVSVSESGRAPHNDPALFALAIASADKSVSRMAFEALPRVARIGTHLFHFAQYMQAFRGWGKLARKGIANWYQSRDAESLAHQMIKYRQRDGWTHRDLLRLSHPTGANAALYEWICRGTESEGLPGMVRAFETLQRLEDPADAARLVSEANLPREAVPDRFLSSVEVWGALLEKMPLTAMIRNLGKMSAVGLIKPLSEGNRKIVAALTSPETVAKSRVHPIQVLLALRTYRSGRGAKGSLSWPVSTDVLDALEVAYGLSFANVKPAGKRFLLALDVSGSMSSPLRSGLTCAEAAAAMAVTTIRSEERVHTMAFASEFRALAIGKSSSLDEACRLTAGLNFGATDCALPMLHALDKGIDVDVFVVYTDSETWCGGTHPVQALAEYRRTTGIPAKLCVMAMAGNGFSIADPNDAGMLDVVGFDASVPQILAEFAD